MSEVTTTQQEDIEEKRRLIFERINHIVLQNLNKTNTDSTVKIRSYSKEDIRRFNEAPDKSQKQLREISNYLFITSPHYRRLIHHFSLMPTFDFAIVPYAVKKTKSNKKMFEQTFYNISEYLNAMNLKYEIPKIMINCFKEDTFFGYVYSNLSTFFIRKLDSQYCAISSIENGLLVFQYDFSYFTNRKDKLEEYGEEFTQKYKIYEKDKKQRWQELELKNTCCFKVNDEELRFSVPPFSGVFESVMEVDEFKKLNLNKEKINNYKIIFEKIPLNIKDGDVDSFLVSLDEALKFHSMTASAIGDQVGLALTPFDINTVDFKTSATAESNKVNEALENLWGSAGVASGLMGSDKANSGSIIQMSIRNDEAISFRLLRQIEKWVNYRISNFNTENFKFKMEFLNSTIYNFTELITAYQGLATYGLPVLSKLNALVGIQGEEIVNLNYLENEILGLQSKFIPLANSHSTNVNDTGGRPTADGVSDSKDKTVDGDTNADRVK